jgi:hypothetical protein
MLIETIQFEIRDFTNGTAESFMVHNTSVNYELIAAQRHTRDIQFTQVFDFQFNKEMHIPPFILDYEADMLAEMVQDFMDAHELEYELDNVDQMV